MIQKEPNKPTGSGGVWQHPTIFWTKPTKVTSFSNEAISKAAPILTEIKQDPFVQQLLDGTLPKDKHIFYVNQITFYLASVAKALARIASRSENDDYIKPFIEFAHHVISARDKYTALYPISYPKSLICEQYTSFMLDTVNSEKIPLPVAIATLLPSCWIYNELANHLNNTINQQSLANNPYATWITEVFYNKEFDEISKVAINMMNQMADKVPNDTKTKMLEMFLKSSEMEYQFVNSITVENIALEQITTSLKVINLQ